MCYASILRVLALVFWFPVFVTGCVVNRSSSTCPSGTGSPMRVFELYFGRAINGRGDLTEAEWDKFRNDVIIPNLPNGFTVLDGRGAWLNPQTRTTISETTKIVVAAVPDTAANADAIGRVRAAYVHAFAQLSVGMTSQISCASFSAE